MKKIIFPAALTFFIISAAQAQISRPQKNEVKKTTAETPVKIIKSIPPPLPPVNKDVGTNTQYTPVYSLTGVRVNFRTGTDNKEFPSEVDVLLWKNGHHWDTPNELFYASASYKNEMAVNSNTDIGLNKWAGNADKFSLANLQTSGVEMIVVYRPNFFLDAWKINNISLTLEFRDQNGNLHPTLGSKNISFSTAIGFLNQEYFVFKCKTDQYFTPLSATIEKKQ